MSYTTDFEGSFKISPPLSQEHVRELTAFSEERHGGNMTPFAGFPGFWCDWAPNEDGTELSWNGGEKFYDYVEWLALGIQRFFKRGGRTPRAGGPGGGGGPRSTARSRGRESPRATEGSSSSTGTK